MLHIALSAIKKSEPVSTLDDVLRGRDIYDLDPSTLPVETAGMPEWDYMEPRIRGRMLGGMLRHVVKAAKQTPIYRDDSRWRFVSAENIYDIADLAKLPIVAKDSVPGTGTPEKQGIHGFRSRVIHNPFLLIPENVGSLFIQQQMANSRTLRSQYEKEWYQFKSGGSMGDSTTTILSYLTLEAEAHALARCLRMNGFKEGMSVACFYASTHKGGLQLARASVIMNMPFHSKDKIFNTIASDSRYTAAVEGFKEALSVQDIGQLERYGSTVRRGIRDYIAQHGIKVVESVQPPSEFIEKNAKGNALAFMTLYEEDPSAFEEVEHVFLTGFPIPYSAVERLRADGKEVSTTWGSTEVMALGTYPMTNVSNNDVNDLVATPFPAIGMVAHFKERGVAPQIEQVQNGTEGMLLVTRLNQVGSLFVQYAIGDLATRTNEGYKNIRRASTPNIAGSCADDALSL